MFSPIELGNVAIIGLGTSGNAAAEFCVSHLAGGKSAGDGVSVESVEIYAGKSTDATKALASRYVEAGIEVIFDCEDVKAGYDLAVVSPGISVNSAFYKSAQAAATQIISEPELAYRISPEDWIGITGTNGKTTTTMLICHLLNASGVKSVTVGNIGDPCIAAIEKREAGEVFAAELSSYQITSMPTFKPRVGVLLNVTPDHLAWHGSHECYTQAKFSMFANMDAGDYAIVDCCDSINRDFALGLAQRGVAVIALGGPNGMDDRFEIGSNCAFMDGDTLVVSIDGVRHELCKAGDLQIKGEHNLQNALAASAAAIAYGCADTSVIAGLESFSPVEHRIEPCGNINGVRFFNDSKATNVDAVLKALTAFSDDDGLVILLGGRDKGTDLSELVEKCMAKCKSIICYGESKERFLEAFNGYCAEFGGSEKVIEATGMLDALKQAAEIAASGDCVLLSPACASFDEFNSFEHRGEVFKQAVAEMSGKSE